MVFNQVETAALLQAMMLRAFEPQTECVCDAKASLQGIGYLAGCCLLLHALWLQTFPAPALSRSPAGLFMQLFEQVYSVLCIGCLATPILSFCQMARTARQADVTCKTVTFSVTEPAWSSFLYGIVCQLMPHCPVYEWVHCSFPRVGWEQLFSHRQVHQGLAQRGKLLLHVPHGMSDAGP